MPIRGYRQEDHPRLIELLEKSFKGAENDHRFNNLHKEKPIADDWSRIYEYIPGEDEGLDLEEPTFVAHCGVWEAPVQYGQAKLLEGTVRDVCSHPITRGLGFGLQVVADARKFMFEKGVDFSILFTGSYHFYAKNGWISGLKTPLFILTAQQLNEWLTTSKESDQFRLDEITVRPSEPADLESLSDLYTQTQPGHYISAQRDLNYWQLHFDTRPNRYNNYIILEFQDQLLGYFNFEMGSKKENTNSVYMHIDEARIAPSVSMVGSPELDLVIRAFFKFMIEEALGASDKFDEVQFALSQVSPIVQHFFNEGYQMRDLARPVPGEMILLTNPYTFFERIQPEIQARAKDGLIPTGSLAIQFENGGTLEGGTLIENVDGQANVTVYQTNADFEANTANAENLVVFPSVSQLGLVVLGSCTVDEIDPPATELRGEAKIWLDGLFGNIVADFTHLDHA